MAHWQSGRWFRGVLPRSGSQRASVGQGGVSASGFGGTAIAGSSGALPLPKVQSLLCLHVSQATCSVMDSVGKAGHLLALSGPRFQPQSFFLEFLQKAPGSSKLGNPTTSGGEEEDWDSGLGVGAGRVAMASHCEHPCRSPALQLHHEGRRAG